jgi:lipopolysaccharide biosynthesis protein
MVIEKEHAHRLGIYFFYDAQGVVDRYVDYFLDDMLQNLTELYIVCNGKVEEASLSRLQKYSKHILVRKNEELDVGAYREVMRQIGYDKLANYDEVVLMNATIYGPIYPFRQMFSEMEQRDVDFWGITSHGADESNPFPRNGLKDLPEHIQSHFLVVRKPVLQDAHFRNHWENMPKIKSYEDSVAFHEVLFTKKFAELGYTWSTYVGTEHLSHITLQPVLGIPTTLVRDYHCPIVKRRSFFQIYFQMIHETNGEQSRELFEFLQKHTDYPMDYIWENLLRTCHLSDLHHCLQWNYILPDSHMPQRVASQLRVALWMHIYYEDQAEICARYAAAMPARADIIVTTDTTEKEHRICQCFSDAGCGNVKVIQIQNRGRDNSALLVGCAPYLKDYDIICFAHDKKVRQLKLELQGKSFFDHCFENTLKSKCFVEHVIAAFEDNPRLGMLCPTPPYASVYYNTIGVCDWGPNFDKTEDLYHRLGLMVPISKDKEPIAPFGSVFWFRSDAMKLLFEQNWTYEDFPAEPVAFDGTLLHALERIYAYVAQQKGYYSGWVLSSSFAAVEFTNYHYMLRELNTRLIPICGSENFAQLRFCVEKVIPVSWRVIYYPIKVWLKKHLSDENFYKIQKIKKIIFG